MPHITNKSSTHKTWKTFFIILIFFSYIHSVNGNNKPETSGHQKSFHLTNQFGKKWSVRQAQNKIIVLFFGYTLCPDFCPLTYEKLNHLKKLLGPRAKNLLPVMVTLDPHRDTAKKLKTYVEFYYPGSLGLTGTKKEIDRVVRDFKAQYEVTESHSAAGYLIDHSTDIYLLNSRGQLIRTFTYQVTANKMYSFINKNMKKFNLE